MYKLKDYFKLKRRKEQLLKRKVLFTCLILFFSRIICQAQTGKITGSGKYSFDKDGTLHVTGQLTFSSYINDTDNSENTEDMVQLNVRSLFKSDADLRGYINGFSTPDNSIILSIYTYDAPSKGKGQLIYRIKNKHDSQSYNTDQVQSPLNGKLTIPSDQIKALLQGALTNYVHPTLSTNLIKSSLAYYNGKVPPYLLSATNSENKGNNYMINQPVIIEISVTDADVHPNAFKFPGQVDIYDLTNYFDPAHLLKVDVYVNDRYSGTYDSNHDIKKLLGVHLGDRMTYKVHYSGINSPQIFGMPGVWIARFAGDLMYYCSPSVTPGEYNPFIGYDSRVHTLPLRNYPKGFKIKADDWIKDDQNNWNWSYTVKRGMEFTFTKEPYTPTWIWKKWQTGSQGDRQRDDQREGLNIQFLNYWQNGFNSDYSTYNGQAKYVLGFDDDELMMMNTSHWDSKAIPPPNYPNGGIAKLDSLPSRAMPEGDTTVSDVRAGYPVQGNSLNTIITAYRRNHKSTTNPYLTDLYDGYEIQDNGTDENFPDGNGTGNNKAPGLITIRAGYQVVRIGVQTVSPINDSKGFYSTLTGEQWPAYAEQGIPYTLHGLKNLTDAELDKISMAYESERQDATVVKRISDLSKTEKEKIRTTGDWTATFNNFAPVYSCITAYYKGTTDSVIIAGKELKPIHMLFFGDKTLEGQGIGAYVFWNDYRTVSDSVYTLPKNFATNQKFVKPYVRSYTYPMGTTTTFTAWDGDPHLFYEKQEWFLSSRTKAKRVPDNYLDGSGNHGDAYLRFYVDGQIQPITKQSNGKDFTYTWNIPGKHILTVKYRNSEQVLCQLSQEINIVNYQTDYKGKIVVRPLNETEQLILKYKNADDAYILEPINVLSKYKYVDGPRVPQPKGPDGKELVNRWADFNDYDSRYTWTAVSGTKSTTLMNSAEAQNYINSYNPNSPNWFWINWANHYSSNWRDRLKAQSDGKQGIPDYVDNRQVTRITTLQLDTFQKYIKEHLFTPTPTANWQYLVPLISYCDHQGLRMRYNPSHIYDINAMWDNRSGAFSGNAAIPNDPNYSLAPDISNIDKDAQDLYDDLISGKKVIVKSLANVSEIDCRSIKRDNTTTEIEKVQRGQFASFVNKFRRFTYGQTIEYKESYKTYVDTAWRGERINTQIIIVPSFTNSELQYVVGDLTNGNNIISKSTIRLRFEKDVTGDMYPANCGEQTTRHSALISDALSNIPITKLQPDNPIKIWVTIDVPANTQPGLYSGLIQIKSGNLNYPMSVSILVVNHKLPPVADWTFHLDLWQFPFQLTSLHNDVSNDKVIPFKEKWTEMMQPFYRLLADAGQSAITTYIKDGAFNKGQTMIKWLKYNDNHWEFDYTDFDDYVEMLTYWGITKQINCFSLSGWQKNSLGYIDANTHEEKELILPIGSDTYNNLWTSFLIQFRSHLIQKGWFNKTVLFMDETDTNDMRKIISVIKNSGNDWKIGLTGTETPTEVSNELYDYSAVLANTHVDAPPPNPIKTFYTSCNWPTSPNTYVTPQNSSGELAWAGWYAANAKLNGYLHWAYDYWTKINPTNIQDGSNTAGDYNLIYRSSNEINSEAMSSTRLELLREGIQDYEKIRLLGSNAEISSYLKLFTIQSDISPSNLVQKGESLLKKISTQQ